MTHPSGPPLLTVRNVSKRFGGVHALRKVNLDLHGGEVVALVGDNGAGKSTLIKVIAGVGPMDEGTMEWEGRGVHIKRPHQARDLGIATLYQDLGLCDNLDVVGNLFLGREITRTGVLDEVEMERRARALLDTLALHLPGLGVPVASLSGGQRQTVAIARSLLGDPKVVLLDEPTSALAVGQSVHVLDLIEQLRERGLGVLLVSHNMSDIKAVADRVVVLRLGRNNGVFDVRTTSQEQIISAITGATENAVAQRETDIGETEL